LNKIILSIDSKFYELQKDLSIIKIENMLTRDLSDDICLFASTKKESIGFFEVHETSLNEKALIKRAKDIFSGQKVQIMKENITDDDMGKLMLVYFSSQVAFNDIFKKYAFKTIIPLDYILYKFKVDVVSIVSENLIYNKRFKNLNSLLPGVDTTLLENRTPEDFINTILLHEKYDQFRKAIITPLKLKKSNNIKLIDYNTLFKLIQAEKTFILHDKVSLNYQAKTYKKLLMGLSLLLLIATPYFFYQYISNKTYKNIYEKSIDTYSKDNSRLKNSIESIKKKLVYKEYKDIDIDKIIDNINSFSSFKGIKDLSFTFDGYDLDIKLIFEDIASLKKFIDAYPKSTIVKKGKNRYIVNVIKNITSKKNRRLK
jgi:hypothetical protein